MASEALVFGFASALTLFPFYLLGAWPLHVLRRRLAARTSVIGE